MSDILVKTDSETGVDKGNIDHEAGQSSISVGPANGEAEVERDEGKKRTHEENGSKTDSGVDSNEIQQSSHSEKLSGADEEAKSNVKSDEGEKIERADDGEKQFIPAGEEESEQSVVRSGEKSEKSVLPSVQRDESGRFTRRPVSNPLHELMTKKTKKPTTLERSRQQWESYKDQEGIAEELSTYNRGRSGYLERKDFLERTDHRQFERERDLRLSKKRKATSD